VRRLKAMLARDSSEEMTSWPVSTRVGNVNNNGPKPDRADLRVTNLIKRLAALFVVFCARQIHAGGDRAWSGAACYFFAGLQRGMFTRQREASSVCSQHTYYGISGRSRWFALSLTCGRPALLCWLSDAAYAPDSGPSHPLPGTGKFDPKRTPWDATEVRCGGRAPAAALSYKRERRSCGHRTD
jgi:hypothetical protein